MCYTLFLVYSLDDPRQTGLISPIHSRILENRRNCLMDRTIFRAWKKRNPIINIILGKFIDEPKNKQNTEWNYGILFPFFFFSYSFLTAQCWWSVKIFTFCFQNLFFLVQSIMHLSTNYQLYYYCSYFFFFFILSLFFLIFCSPKLFFSWDFHLN